jgi:hypothetical protein
MSYAPRAPSLTRIFAEVGATGTLTAAGLGVVGAAVGSGVGAGVAVAVTTATDGAGLALGDATGSAVVAGAEPTQAALTSITMAAVARVGPPGQRDRVVVLMLGTTPVTGRFDTCPSSCAVDDHLVGSVTMSVAKRLRPRDEGVARPATHLQSEVRRRGDQLGCRTYVDLIEPQSANTQRVDSSWT